jgi:hypothetical protein
MDQPPFKTWVLGSIPSELTIVFRIKDLKHGRKFWEQLSKKQLLSRSETRL